MSRGQALRACTRNSASRGDRSRRVYTPTGNIAGTDPEGVCTRSSSEPPAYPEE
jgi:hypothetical protein